MTSINSQILSADVATVRERLKANIIEKSIKIAPPDQPFTLTSGLKSHHYVNGKKTCADPEGLLCLSRLILDKARTLEVDAVGGPTLGADPIVGAVSALSFLTGQNLPWFIIRKEPKGHGTQSQIEGIDIQNKKVIMVEDVITTGGSVIKAIKVAQSLGCIVVDTIAIVDREQGGREAFEEIGVSYSPLFSISELLPQDVLQREI